MFVDTMTRLLMVIGDDDRDEIRREEQLSWEQGYNQLDTPLFIQDDHY